MSDDDKLTRNIAVPAWMVYLFSGLLTVLAGGAVATIVAVVNRVFILQHDQGDLKREVGEVQVKQADIVAAVGSLQKEFTSGMRDLERHLDSIDGRLGKVMP